MPKSKRRIKRKEAKKTVHRVKKNKRVKKVTRKKVQPKKLPAKLPALVAGFLKKTKARFEALGHKTVFTAFDAAQTLKVDLGSVGKTLVLQDGGDTIVAVVPASHNVDLKALAKAVTAHRARHGKPRVGKLKFASERVIKSRLKAVPGAVPPFGPLHGLETFVDKRLTKPRSIIVSGGSFQTSLSMMPAELLRLSQAVVGSFSSAR